MTTVLNLLHDGPADAAGTHGNGTQLHFTLTPGELGNGEEFLLSLWDSAEQAQRYGRSENEEVLVLTLTPEQCAQVAAAAARATVRWNREEA
jgi:hypothetical protein